MLCRSTQKSNLAVLAVWGVLVKKASDLEKNSKLRKLLRILWIWNLQGVWHIVWCPVLQLQSEVLRFKQNVLPRGTPYVPAKALGGGGWGRNSEPHGAWQEEILYVQVDCTYTFIYRYCWGSRLPNFEVEPGSAWCCHANFHFWKFRLISAMCF